MMCGDCPDFATCIHEPLEEETSELHQCWRDDE